MEGMERVERAKDGHICIPMPLHPPPGFAPTSLSIPIQTLPLHLLKMQKNICNVPRSYLVLGTPWFIFPI